MTKPKPAPKWEYRVSYRRRWWKHPVGHVYQTLPPVKRLLAKLDAGGRDYRDLEPIEEMWVQRRRVGEWENVNVRNDR